MLTEVIGHAVVCRTFIGRSDELAFLHEKRLAAGRSRGNIVLVAGEAGVGKSRLLLETQRLLKNSRWRVARGACLEFGGRPYGAIVDVLAQLRVGKGPFETAQSKIEQLEAISNALCGCAAKAGIAIFIEDIHWADIATVEALLHLSHSVNAHRVLVVATYRSDEIQADHPLFTSIARLTQNANVATLTLAPLNERQREEFIDETLADARLSFETRATIARLSDGNPFFMEELLKQAIDRERHDDVGGTTMPFTVQAAIGERLQRLEPAQRDVLAQAAVIGRRFDVSLLARTMRRDAAELWPALRRARDLQIIIEDADGAFRFRHALSREAIYGSFLVSEVRERHRNIALTIESEQQGASIENLAYHWWAAGDRARAGRYSELAGDAAANMYAHDDAIAAYEQALKCTDDLRDRARLLQKIGDHRVALGQFAGAQSAHNAAANAYKELNDHEPEAIWRVRASLHRYTLDLPHPAADLEAMLARTPLDEYMARSRLHLGIAWIVASFNNPTAAMEHLRAVDERAPATADDVALRFFNIRAWVNMLLGDLDAFASDHERWVSAAERLSNAAALASAWYNGAYCFALFGAHERAAAAMDAARDIAQRERNRNLAASANGVRAVNAVLRGDLHDARAALCELEALPTDNAVTRAHAVAAATLVGIHTGDDALITRWYDPRKPVSTFLAAEYGAGCAEVLVRDGRIAEAQALLREGIGKGERQRGNALTLLAVARYGTDDDCERARAVLQSCAQAASDVIERPALALFDAIRFSRSGDAESARRHASIAADGFSRMGFRLLQAASLELAGEREAAREIYAQCGAGADVHRCTSRTPSRKNGRADQQPLSAREREVAALVARGYSNLRIARELGISEKTVEKYVGFAFGKLGISSRAQLAAHIARSQGA